MWKYQHFSFCSFTVLNRLKALQLSKVGLSTIKRQHSKNLTWWTEATWTKTTWKIANCLQVCSRKVFKMSIICTDTCLEVLSSLVICTVDNVQSEIGTGHYRQCRWPVKKAPPGMCPCRWWTFWTPFVNKLANSLQFFMSFWFKWLLSIMSDFYCVDAWWSISLPCLTSKV